MKISIITVSYKAESTIAETIKSVAAQDWPDFEHIIVDGASTDGTLEIVRELAHPRLRLISEPDKGIYDAMNKGLAAATGEYVAFLNADDLYSRPDALSLVAKAALASSADCILGDTEFINSSGSAKYGRLYSARHFRRWWLRFGIMPPHPSFFARRLALLATGGFDTSYSIAADFDLVARLILRDRASWYSLGVVTTFFRVGGLSTRGENVNQQLSKEFCRSLDGLGSFLPAFMVRLRYPFKILQYLPAASRAAKLDMRRTMKQERL
jgi:glycosyltransferase involved in cell wall biosynthesis